MCVKKEKKNPTREYFVRTQVFTRAEQTMLCSNRLTAEIYSQFHSNYSQLGVLLSLLPTEGLPGCLASLQILYVGYLNQESTFPWTDGRNGLEKM